MDKVKHFKKRISEGTIEVEPFNHCFIENIFPDSYYQEFLSSIPYHIFYEIGDKGLLEVKNDFDKFEKKEFWKDFVEFMYSDEVQDTLITKFNVKRGRPEVMLYFNKMNYQLGPHLDRNDKLFTSLFYLPKDESQLNLGTVLCTCEEYKPFNWKYFKIVKKIPFKPNSFFCFFGNRSYHGVEEIKEDVVRYTMQYLIRS